MGIDVGKHTIETLTADVNSFKRFVKKTLDEMAPKVQEMHEYIIRQQGFEDGKASIQKDGTPGFDPRMFDVIKWALLIAILALGGSKYL